MNKEPYLHFWQSYVDQFDYFSKEQIRPYCHPRILLHDAPVENCIVLVHGLTDSPYFLEAIARHFHTQLGYNVYLPLLQCHGLKEPGGMDDASLDQWKRNVSFAIDHAHNRARRVSIGGLSTGGTLSYYFASTDDRINAELYLFSAALDLAGGILPGNVREALLRSEQAVDAIEAVASVVSNVKAKASRLASLIRRNQTTDNAEKTPLLIGENPYRYDAMDLDGARQLAILIAETDKLTAAYSTDNPFSKRVFIAHSEADSTAAIRGAKALEQVSADASTFYIPKTVMVSREVQRPVKHAELVLQQDIVLADPDESEYANPEFDKMLHAVTTFARCKPGFA